MSFYSTYNSIQLIIEDLQDELFRAIQERDAYKDGEEDYIFYDGKAAGVDTAIASVQSALASIVD